MAEIDKVLTPEEYYQRVFTRLTLRGEAFVKEWGPVVYNINKNYKFSYDKSGYKFISTDNTGNSKFLRITDGGNLTMTKYGERPVEL